MKQPPHSLTDAYRQARYEAQLGNDHFEFRVGQVHPWLDSLMSSHHTACAAFITPFNPASRILPEQENLIRLQSLAERLSQQGFTFFDGHGQDDAGLWPAEASFLILDITRQEATAFASDYGQNAFLYMEKHHGAELVLLTAGDEPHVLP